MRCVYAVLFGVALASVLVLAGWFETGTRFLDHVALLVSLTLAVLAAAGWAIERRASARSIRIAVRILVTVAAVLWLVAAVLVVRQAVSEGSADTEIGNALNNSGMYR